jgi:hypothetical protein
MEPSGARQIDASRGARPSQSSGRDEICCWVRGWRLRKLIQSSPHMTVRSGLAAPMACHDSRRS